MSRLSPSAHGIRSFATSSVDRRAAVITAVSARRSDAPPYPYPPATHYKQQDLGLYGGSQIQFGNNVSTKWETKTRRTWQVNIHKKRLWSNALQAYVEIKVQARVLRTIDKVGGLDEYLLGDTAGRIKELGPTGWALRWRIMQTPSIRERIARERQQLGLPREGVKAEEARKAAKVKQKALDAAMQYLRQKEMEEFSVDEVKEVEGPGKSNAPSLEQQHLPKEDLETLAARANMSMKALFTEARSMLATEDETQAELDSIAEQVSTADAEIDQAISSGTAAELYSTYRATQKKQLADLRRERAAERIRVANKRVWQLKTHTARGGVPGQWVKRSGWHDAYTKYAVKEVGRLQLNPATHPPEGLTAEQWWKLRKHARMEKMNEGAESEQEAVMSPLPSGAPTPSLPSAEPRQEQQHQQKVEKEEDVRQASSMMDNIRSFFSFGRKSKPPNSPEDKPSDDQGRKN